MPYRERGETGSLSFVSLRPIRARSRRSSRIAILASKRRLHPCLRCARGVWVRVAQKQVATATPYITQGAPERIARREVLSHDQTGALIALPAAGNLR